jgi:glutathione S-transferase
MIILYGGGPSFGLPEVSSYVTKTEVQLKMARLAYRKQPALPMDGPKGKMPWIDDDGERVGDSHFIRLHIQWKYSLDLDEGLDARQRAEAWTVERMLEDHLAWASNYFRWLVPANFAKGPAHFLDRAPEHLREQLRVDLVAKVEETYRMHGIARHAGEEVAELGRRSLDALSVLLGDRLYLTGGQVCGADATALGVLAGVLTPFFSSPLRDHAERLPNLVGYVERMMLRYYPDFAWGSAEVEAAAA